ncbi:hypothetical protein K469DRAFT_684120 [Zopfia rhizophila CBS 207.26]|uniref:Apple domain-containing protein n=1 Tax=Zopfia rhizophila CBS 207.26 TaxID=1314779 RepID=A0A6A6EDD7_9PEZI|nr:hypothetical protein K469DRAFT_684120 [Zopfia rhizophila CBS 207.26]
MESNWKSRAHGEVDPVIASQPMVAYDDGPIIYNDNNYPIVIERVAGSEGSLIPLEKPEASPKTQRICGMRRVTFALGIVIAILLVTAGVLGGLFGAERAKTAKASKTTSPSSLNPFSTVTPTLATPTSTSVATTLGPGNVTVECPSSNGTTFSSRGQSFLRLCRYAYTFDDGAIDVSEVTAQSMGECIDQCTGFNEKRNETNGDGGETKKCIGVGWDFRKPQGEESSFCVLKSKLGQVTFWEGVEFAVLED